MRCLMWFVIGALLGIALMYVYGMGYDYICLDVLRQGQIPIIAGPLA